jgi:hypothetical protein
MPSDSGRRFGRRPARRHGRARFRSGAAGAAALVALVSTVGCATAPLRPPAGIAEQARSAGTYSGSLHVSLRGDLRARTRALVAFRRPAALRVEIPGPTGARLIVVARDGALTAVFPGERAVYLGEASERGLEILLGVSLTPAEVMDLLVGVPSPRLRAYEARWGPLLPRRIAATLPDGGRLKVTVEDADLGADVPASAFDEPPHRGYRSVDAEEARSLWQ